VLRRVLGPTLFVAALALPHPAQAQDAQALFDEGLANMKSGRLKIGCALIKQSLDVDARPGTLFTLAECYSRAGKFASAMSLYDRFLSTYEAMPADQQEQQKARADLSRSERTRLVSQVAWLTVTLPMDAPANVVVTLDGEEFAPGLFGVATAIDPGPHVFTTRAPDGPLIEQRIDVSPGERKATILEVQSAGASPSPPQADQEPAPYMQEESPESPPRKKSVTPWVYVSGAVGGAGLVTGAVTGVMLLQKRSIIKSDCPVHQCNREGYSAVQDAQNTLAPITTVAFSVGAAGALATVLLLVTEGGGGAKHAGGRTPVPVVALTPQGGSLGFKTGW
jgi:hypothetical protein